MAAQLIESTDIISVEHMPILIYGPPGCGKTSLAQTSDNPFTLDFDKGIHRSFNRKRAMRFDTWGDCLQEQKAGRFAEYGTIVLDTLGALLDAMSKDIQAESAKNAMGGGLSIQGWGVLGNRFGQWIRGLVASGQDVVMLCHADEEKSVSGTRVLRPAMPGKMAYNAVHRMLDIMGHIEYDGKNRYIEFPPSDEAVGKDAAQWGRINLPDLAHNKTFLADLFADAKAKIGRTAEASAAIARVTDQWQEQLDADPSVDDLNAMLPALGKLVNGEKRLVWLMVRHHAEKCGLVFDATLKVFVRKGAA